MSDQNGFVKLPRDLFPNKKTSPFYGHPNLWFVFSLIIPKVRFGESTNFNTPWGDVEIHPQEFVLNRKQLMWESGLPKVTLHDCLKKLEKLGVIFKKRPTLVTDPGTDPTHRPSQAALYALTDKYYNLIYNCTPTLPTEQVTDPTHRPLKKKEEEKEKEKNKIKENQIKSVPTSVEVETTDIILLPAEPPKIKRQALQIVPTGVQTQIAKEWLRIAFSYFPWRENEGKWTELSFAQELNKVQKKLSLSDAQLEKIFQIYRESDFWRDKVIPATLLSKNKAGIRKIEHLMKEETKKYAVARMNEEFLAKYCEEK